MTFTGETTPAGLRVATHCTENTPSKECVAGWILRGKPGRATLLYQNVDHPVWLVRRSDIPQPGGYGHFHWLGEPQHPEALVPGQEYEGYFLELHATRAFGFEHEGEVLEMSPGLDLRTHLNLLTSLPDDGGTGGH